GRLLDDGLFDDNIVNRLLITGLEHRDLVDDILGSLIYAFAEGRVFAVQEIRGFVADEELRAGGIRVAAAGHRKGAGIVLGRVEFGLDGVAAAAGAAAER